MTRTNQDREVNQRFAVFNILVGYTNQQLTPTVIERIVEDLATEMVHGGSSWAFKEDESLKKEIESLRALEQSWENTRHALASLRNDYDSMRLRAEKAEHELAMLKALYEI